MARIGWFYTDSPDFPQTKAGPVVLHWGACAKAGGTRIYFPLHKHIYQGDNGNFSTSKPTVALLSGPPRDPHDPFKATVYVGDLATPGMTNLHMTCKGLKFGDHGPLVTKKTGPLKTNYVRQDVNFSPAGSLFAADEFSLFGTGQQTAFAINRSCSEPGTKSITYGSIALSGGSATLGNESQQGTFSGPVTPSGAGPGKYATTVSCGSGRVGVGTISIR